MYDSFDIPSIEDTIETYTTGMLRGDECQSCLFKMYGISKDKYSVDLVKELILKDHHAVDVDEFMGVYDHFLNSFGDIPAGYIDKEQIKSVLKVLMNRDILSRCRWVNDGSYLNNCIRLRRKWLRHKNVRIMSFSCDLGTEFYSLKSSLPKSKADDKLFDAMSVTDQVRFIGDNFETIWLMMPRTIEDLVLEYTNADPYDITNYRIHMFSI